MKSSSSLLNYLYIKSFSEKAACVESYLLFTIHTVSVWELRGSKVVVLTAKCVYSIFHSKRTFTEARFWTL